MPTIPLILRDAPFDEPTELDVPPGVVTVVHRAAGVTLSDLPALFDTHYPRLGGAGPIGPGYAKYVGDPMRTFDVEFGFPVAAVPEGFDTGEFPSGRALALSHIGGFDGLGDSWQRLMADFAARGLTSVRAIAEVYTSDPSHTPPEEMRTDLYAFY